MTDPIADALAEIKRRAERTDLLLIPRGKPFDGELFQCICIREDALREMLAEMLRWRPIAELPDEHRHGNWVRVWTEAGALYVPDRGPATHYLLFPATPSQEPTE